MKKLQGLSYESIALELNIPIGTIQPYIKRGLRDVTNHLKHNVGSYIIFLLSFSLGL
jgi:DNA-directed RNA polymerase specialized sigma24 family protein